MTTTTEELPRVSPPATRRPRVTTAQLLERLELTKNTPDEWCLVWEFPVKGTAGPRATQLRALTEGQGYEITTEGGRLIAQYVGGKETKT